MMKQRIITAIVLGIVAIPVCVFSDTVVFPIVWAILGAVGVYELLGCMGTKDNKFISFPLYAMALVAPFAVRYFREELQKYSAIIVFTLFLFPQNAERSLKPLKTSLRQSACRLL